MKKILLLSASALISFISVAGENVREAIRPTYLIPGAELKVAKAKSIVSRSRVAAPEIHKISAKSMTDMPQVKFVRTNGTALDVTPKNVITIDTALVVSYDYYYNDMWENRTEENKAKIEYDKYGRRSLLTQGNDSTRYAYTVDENTLWLSRVVEHKEADGWFPVSKEERTIENNLVKSITIYKVAGDDFYTLDFCKDKYYEFEYGHSDYTHVYENGKYIRNAAITREISFSEQGDTIEDRKYTWVNYADSYLCTYYFSGTNKSESRIYDDRVVTTSYYRPYSHETGEYLSDFIKNSETTVFYGKKHGRLEIIFNEDGTESNTNGYLVEGWREASGDSIMVSYKYTDSEFVPSVKYIYSADYFKPKDYTKDFYESYSEYIYNDGKWMEHDSYSLKHTLLPNRLSELTQTYGSSTTSTTVKMEKIIDDDSERWESYAAIVNEDGSYSVVKEGNDSDYIYSYYSAEGSLLKTIWQKEFRNPDGTVFLIQLPGETTWNPLEEHTNTISAAGITQRTVYKTNSDGTPQSVTEYTTHPSYNGGKEFKTLETFYTYKPNGDFTAETYETYTPSDITKLAISEKSERLTLEDGTIQITELEYDENGKGQIYSGRRTEFKDYLTKEYTYVRRSDTWAMTNAYVEEEIYTTENGVEVKITRRLSDDNNYAVYETKSEEIHTYDADGNDLYYMNARYNWDSDNNKWIGIEKYDCQYFHFIFDCQEQEHIFDPIAAYNDEYMLVIENEPYNYPEFSDSKGRYYYWDNENNIWIPDNMETLDYKLDGNTLTKIRTNHEENEWGITDSSAITKKTRDSFSRISEIEEIEEQTRVPNPGEEAEHSFSRRVTSYTYNETNGLLSEKKEVSFDEDGKEIWSNIYHYTYSTFNIETSEITDIVKDDNSGIIIDGLNVSAAGEIISVFNIKGQLISRESEATTLPSVPGIYIIKAGNCTHKIAIR